VAARQAGQVDVGQGDRVTGSRLRPRGPVGQRLELADELVLAVARLGEGVAVELVPADPPAPLAVARRGARLHLQNEDPALLVDDHEVRLAVAGRPAGRIGPSHSAFG